MSIWFRLRRRLCWKLFSLMGKSRKKIVFNSYYGRGYSDSPKAIAEEFISRGGYKLYWLVKNLNHADDLPKQIKPLVQDSVKAIWHEATAAVWIDNCRKMDYVEKGRGQLYMQTWHGFPLKRIERDAEQSLEEYYVKAAKKDSQMCDVMLSNGSFLTQIYMSGFWYDGQVLDGGFPRNDVLVNGDEEAAARALKKLQLQEEYRYLLYAPTFRKERGLSAYDMDYAACVRAMEQRFGGRWKILAKLHPNVADKAGELELDENFVLNASSYPDIQDLYLLADAMITDYSSVMFDYMATGKPCFLYVNDLQSYKSDRNFYLDLDSLPFPRAESNSQLVEVILSYDDEGKLEEIEQFSKTVGIAESGVAAKRAADYIVDNMTD